jgi:hypothetical protein
MTQPALHRGSSKERLQQWIHAVAAMLVGSEFFALWFWLLPAWLGFQVDTAGQAR